MNIKLWGNHRWGIYRELRAESLSILISEFNQLTTSVNKNRSKEHKLFQSGSNYAILARLCEQYYVYEGSDKLQQRVVAEVETIISELRNDNKANNEFEELINRQRDGLMSRFRAEHPTLKEKDIRLYAYLVAGFSATTIAVLIDKDKSVVYNRISRLKRTIKEEFNKQLC